MTTRANKVLIVDDDAELLNLLTDYLTLENFSVTCAHNGQDALTQLGKDAFDLMVLDVMMPGMSGVEVLARVRETYDIPVLMLTGKGDPVDRILGLEMGADDYVPKPCPPRGLVARMRAILRRSAPSDAAKKVLDVGGLTIDLPHRRATYKGKSIPFTGTEMTLLHMLAKRAGTIVSKEEIYPHVLGRPMGRFDRAIDVHVSTVRHKLNEAAGDALRIEAMRGVG